MSSESGNAGRTKYRFAKGYEEMGTVQIGDDPPCPVYLETGEGEGGEVPHERFAVRVQDRLFYVAGRDVPIVSYTEGRIDSITFTQG